MMSESYSIHDVGEQENRLRISLNFSEWDIGKAVKSIYRRYAKHCGNTSKYKPHQGAKEKARRLRQMRSRASEPHPEEELNDRIRGYK